MHLQFVFAALILFAGHQDSHIWLEQRQSVGFSNKQASNKV